LGNSRSDRYRTGLADRPADAEADGLRLKFLLSRASKWPVARFVDPGIAGAECAAIGEPHGPMRSAVRAWRIVVGFVQLRRMPGRGPAIGTTPASGLRQAAGGDELPRVQLRPTAANDFMYAAVGHVRDDAVAKHVLRWAIAVPNGASISTQLMLRAARNHSRSARDSRSAVICDAAPADTAPSVSLFG
jgi:hypothetical protein